MMHFSQHNLREDITYWGPGNTTNEFGQTQFDPPVLLKGRWEDKVQQVRRPDGEEVTSSAEVYVNQDVVVSGYLARGNQTSQATPVEGSREIQNFSTVPDLRNLGSQRKAFL